ncbi:MAG TPA: response regulator [Candidatus Cloacimonadota bacterium]|nr:response regulator [Candidatus Cloacimonadota bacterium]HQB40783.1 response regulator [Candidatus Cloacimonadota bacterium]
MNKQKILVLDDEGAIRLLLKKLFERKGFEVIEAASAEEAQEILQKEMIQIMFFDINLPGMNGIELCRLVKRQHPTDIIHAMTGYSSLFELATIREAGFEDYFVKPLKLDAVLKAAEYAAEKISRWRTQKT